MIFVGLVSILSQDKIPLAIPLDTDEYLHVSPPLPLHAEHPTRFMPLPPNTTSGFRFSQNLSIDP